MATHQEIHLHPHNYYAPKRSDWVRTRTYQYVRSSQMNKDFYKGFFNDRHLQAGNQIHFVKIAGASPYSNGSYTGNYTHFQQGRPWSSEETRPPDDKIQNIFSKSHTNGHHSVSFYQKGSGLSDVERKKVTVYMMTGDYKTNLHFGRVSFDLSKPDNERFVDANNPVSNVLDDRTLSKYQKNVIGFSCKVDSSGSHDEDNTAVVSKVGLLYAAFQDNGTPWNDRGRSKNNIFCLECTRQLGPHSYMSKPNKTGETRYLTYTIQKSDWDDCYRYKHFGKHGNSNRAWYHWIGVVIEWHQHGKGSIIKTKTGTMWDFTPIIADNYTSLSTGQTSSFVIPQNFHTLGECKAQANVQNYAFIGVESLNKSVGFVHDSNI